ncbi:MAG: hypothetical protein QMC36_08455 [Patescibacteria group bacterium]
MRTPFGNRFGFFLPTFFLFPAVALAFAEAVAARNPFAVAHVILVHPGSAAFSYLWILALFAFLYSAI